MAARYGHEERKFGIGARLRYWFDNTMARGTPAMVGWLAIFSVALVVVVTAGLIVAGYKGDGNEHNPLWILWGTFASTFGLDVPGAGAPIVLGLFLILALA